MQNIQSRIPLKSLSSEPAAKRKIEGKLITVLLISGEHRVTYLIRKAMAEAGSGTFALEYTDRLSTGLERLATGGIDVLLLDPSVPDSHGLDPLVWESAQAKGVPIIMLSALDDETSETEALKKGAQEYLVKGRVAGNLLVRSIYRAIARQRLASEREQKIQRIESSEAQLYNVIRSNPDSIIIVDHKGIVRFVNPAVESLFGCKAEQLLGESLNFLPTVEGGKIELGIIRGDGEKGVAEIRVVEMQYQGEGAYLASLRDITERKQAEEEAKLSKEVAEARATATDKAAEVAKIASEEAVARAEEEASLAREEVEAAKTASEKAIAKAGKLAEAVKKTSEEALTRVEEEARLSKEEAESVKEASHEAVARAEEESRVAREEVEAAKTASKEASARAKEKTNLVKGALSKLDRIKSEKAALQEAVARAEEEAESVKEASHEAVARAEEEARLAREEAEAAKTASEEASAKAKEKTNLVKGALSKLDRIKSEKVTLQEAIARAEEEAESVKEASHEAVARAEEEARLAKEEAEAAKTASEEASARAKEKTNLVKGALSKLDRIKSEKVTLQEAIARAEEEARLAKEEAETARLVSEEASTRVEEEARLSKEEAEAAKTASEKAIAKAEEEARLAREEAEAAKTASEEASARAKEAITKADKGARLAKEEAEAVKTASEEASTRVEEEARLSKEEAEAAKTASEKAIAKAEEEARLAKKEAEAVKTASEEAVARAKEELHNLDPMQSEFMSNIVHELRAPLHSITGFTKLVLEGGAPDPRTQQEFLNIISDQSEHLRKLVDELADISPVESGHIIKVRKERVSIKDLLQSAVKELYSVANQKNIVLREDIPVTLPRMEVDGQRLRQVMFNLLGNAIKFSDCGGSIIVRAEVRNSDLLVQVTDQGVGIAEESIPYLFEKYYQVKNSAKAGGLGIGLYISKQIIEAHGGHIWAESAAGAGSTFSFTLPMEQPNG